jgi:hypothetical protein
MMISHYVAHHTTEATGIDVAADLEGPQGALRRRWCVFVDPTLPEPPQPEQVIVEASKAVEATAELESQSSHRRATCACRCTSGVRQE